MSGPWTLTAYPSLTQIKLGTVTGIHKIQTSLDISVTKNDGMMLIRFFSPKYFLKIFWVRTTKMQIGAMAGRDKGRSFFVIQGPTCIREALGLLESQGLAMWSWIYLLTMTVPYL